jgi:two-component system sensor histidine kinase/response regulator
MPFAATAYNPFLILLSLVIALVASYTTLDLAPYIQTRSKHWFAWLLCGAVVLGTGIWSMHFLGMLALQWIIPVQYNLKLTLLALVIGIGGAALTLGVLSLMPVYRFAWLGSGVCLGGTIAALHYGGMLAIEMRGEVYYTPVLVGISLGLAFITAFAAFGLSVWFEEEQHRPTLKVASATLIALGITGMHYTGIAATQFSPVLVEQPISTSNVSLAIAVGLGTLLMFSLALLASLYEQKLFRQSLREQTLQKSEERFRLLIQEMQVGVLLTNAQAEIIIANTAALELLHCCEDHELQPLETFGNQCSFIDEQGQPIPLDRLPVQRSIQQHQPIFNEVLGIRLPKGEQRWLLVNVQPQFFRSEGSDPEADSIEQVVCTLSDITSRKRAELTLRQTADRERTVGAIIRQMRQTLDLEKIFGTTTHSLRQVLACDRVLIYRFNADWSGSLIAESVAQQWEHPTFVKTGVRGDNRRVALRRLSHVPRRPSTTGSLHHRDC